MRGSDERKRGKRAPRPSGEAAAQRRPVDAPPRGRRTTREQRPEHSRPHTGPMPRPADGPVRPKNAAQAKARAKARKAKAPKVVRPPLRERLLVRLSSVDLDPRRFVTRVPFVVLVIGALGVGLGVTLWLSTDAAERSYELGRARQVNQALMQQKDGLERDVLEAQAAPALAEAARNLGMIPSRDTAHLVQDASGNWMVVGTPKPAEGVQPPPLNSPLPDPAPPAAPAAPARPAPRVVDPREVAVHMPPAGTAVPNQALPNQAVPNQALPNQALPNPEVPVTGALPGAPVIPVVPGQAPLAAVPTPPLTPGAVPLPPDAATLHLDSPQGPALPGPAPVDPAAPAAPVLVPGPPA
ncbi:hypothetical protein [Mycobacterium sp. Root135]|uniref:hypothetical protein n=1 Tax=Mycobacterium sp. Root135 TaxID=1736457 RepID=UPI00351280E6